MVAMATHSTAANRVSHHTAPWPTHGRRQHPQDDRPAPTRWQCPRPTFRGGRAPPPCLGPATACLPGARVPPDVDQIYTISQSADLGFGPTNLRTSEIFKRHPPVLHVFFSRILVHAEFCWICGLFPQYARARSWKIFLPRARVQYSTLLRAPCMSSLSKRACQSARYGISGTNQPLMGCSWSTSARTLAPSNY